MDVLFSSVSDDWDSMSESSEELEVLYGGQAISLLSNLDETIGKIDDFLSCERAFFHGDVVCLASEPSGQMGRITTVDMLLDLEATNGKLIKDIHSNQILKIRSVSTGDYVVQGSWLGRVDKVIDLVTVVFNDGTKCNVLASDKEDLVPMNSSNTLDDDDPQYPFYPGQRVHAKVPTARWLCGSSHKQGTICAVKPGMVYIHWMASVMNGYRVPPPSKLQDAKDVTLLPWFMHSNWQLGDLCLLPMNNIEEVFVVTKIRTKVDVIWQDGTQSLGLDSKTLLPINIMDAHEFWAHQFVVEKGSHENVQWRPKWGCVQDVDAKEKTVKVKWENESGGEETTVSAYELLDHPDYSFCVGDVVFRLIVNDGQQTENGDLRIKGDTFYLSCIGNVVGFKDGVVEVKWATGLTTMVAPHEIFRFDKYEASAPTPSDMDENVEQIAQQIVKIQDSDFSKEKGKKLQGLLHYFYSNRGFISRILPRWSCIVFITDFAANLFRYSASTSNESSVYDDNNGKESQDFNENNDCEESAVEMQESDLSQKSDKVNEIDGACEPSSLNQNDVQRFKQFDMVTDCSDHFFIDRAGKEITSPQVNKSWLKKVGQEWSILQKNLPESIFVRAYEERMDLFRAAIIGAPGTPYHDGIFFFDIFLPPQYPNEPPRVHYHSGGLRLNPNLYESGKVCLSLLNTWTGGESEVWNPESSTVLQVLVSLQGLVLNEKPYFNEAGYDTHIGKSQGEKNSVSYNENAFLLTCQTMIYLLCNPPKHFEEMVVEHFRGRCPNILGACKKYINGAPVGFASSNIIMKHENDKGSSSSSTGFKIMVSKLFDKLIEAFTHEGIDCGEYVKLLHLLH